MFMELLKALTLINSPINMTTADIIQGILLFDLHFSKQYISLHYPFSEQQVSEYQLYLNHGEAHYSVFIPDTDTVHIPQYGLCWNKNIPWTNALKKQWSLGFWNAFSGCLEGMSSTPIQHGETPANEVLYALIPLDIHKELSIREASNYEWSNNTGEQDFAGFLDDEVRQNSVYDVLDGAGFTALYHRKKAVILYNDSIWQHTLSSIITDEFMQLVMSRIMKYHTLLTSNYEVVPVPPRHKSKEDDEADYEYVKY